MTQYENMGNIIRYSIDELEVIGRYLHEKDEREDPTTVLIGGWAVDSYNSWYGSIDIDLITNASTRKSLMHHLRNDRDFTPYKLPGIPTSVKKETEAGPVIIDFATRQKPFPFEGKDMSLDFSILNGNTETRQIRGGIEMAVPNRATLLVLKLKAVWDRNYRIAHGTSDDIEWETGKLIKDYADVLALIDPDHGGEQIEISVLGRLMEKYPFLEKCITSAYNSDEGIEKYGRMSQDDARTSIYRMISLIH
ncbi:Hypothetical protein Mbur_2013 [Methanococcoides burtonii DSM 6242]|uniref:Uncharacterized protein n=2 Tax=Methanococcoides burtonii TaxID=29291 RepID=Q12UI6_METBU|nr:Hypothetical protein Mbur_2013 [Methanococcoides burtonii DSM 6242]